MCKNCIKVFITITAILSIFFSFTISSFAGNNGEIFFYDGTTITQLTNNDYGDWSPMINNSGQVVWNSTNFGIDIDDIDGGGSGGGGGGG